LRLNKRWFWALGIAAGIVVIIALLSYLTCSERTRIYSENQMNKRLKGYTVHIGKACFNPITFSLSLGNLTLIQNANPNPPVARIQAIYARLYWRDLFRGHVVSEFHIDRPNLFIDLAHFRAEEKSSVPLKNKGWQEAVQAIYPIKINEFVISNGDITYVDKGPYRPLHASRIELRASNIRNVKYPNDVFPSSVHLEGRIFDKGTLSMNGKANFLEEPHMAIKGNFDLADMDLSYFEPILVRSNISITHGTLSTGGEFEYTPQLTAVNLNDIKIDGVDANYVHLPQTAAKEKTRVRRAAVETQQASNNPSQQIRVNAVIIQNGTFAYTDRTSKPGYRIFFSDISGTVRKFSNQLREGSSMVDMRGKFMGSGDTRVTGNFTPETKKADLGLRIAIADTDLRSMNDLFRSSAKVDVKGGTFSLYSEMRIQNGYINGWVKPIFKDIKIGERQDKKNGILHKAYVGTVKALAKALENQPKNQIATTTDISGPIEDPNASIWQVITHLMGNAWIRAILPGFESHANG
jgi:hypothetical protein